MGEITRYIGLQEEYDYKVQSQNVWTYFDINSTDLRGPSEQAVTYPGASTRSVRHHAPGTYITSGAITLPVDSEHFGCVLKGVLGAVESVFLDYEILALGIGDTEQLDVYLHKFTPHAEKATSWRVAVAKDKYTHIFSGIVFNELNLELVDRFLIANLTCLGAADGRQDIAGIETSDLPGHVYKTFRSTTYKNNVDISAKTEDFSFTIVNNANLEAWVPVTSRFPRKKSVHEFSVTGTLVLSFEDDFELKEFWGGDTGPHEDTLTETSLEVVFEEVEGRRELSISLPRVLVQSHSAPVAGRDHIVQTVEYRAVGSKTDEVVEIEMVNETQSYPDPTASI